MGRSVIYVNFAQYDNTGRILDYLVDNFDLVLQFSFDHLRLKHGRKSNYLNVYKNGKLYKRRTLLTFRTRPPFLYVSLPGVAISIMIQTLFYSFIYSFKYGKFDYFLTVNAFSSCVGLLTKAFFISKKSIFWVWDFFPVEYRDWRIKFARWVYLQMDKLALKYSDEVIFTNRKLYLMFRRTNKIYRRGVRIVPIGTEVNMMSKQQLNTPIVGFLGMIKEHQGLDFLFDSMRELTKQLPNVKFEIVGSGPEEDRIRKQARKYKKRIKFYGFVEDQDEINKIIKRWTVGLATYKPISANESYWGDPSKIKKYISFGVPVVTTNVSYFTSEIVRYKAGVVVEYGKANSLVDCLRTVVGNKNKYSRNALTLARKYRYQALYPRLFK